LRCLWFLARTAESNTALLMGFCHAIEGIS
jgi:hypothetical protein